MSAQAPGSRRSAQWAAARRAHRGEDRRGRRRGAPSACCHRARCAQAMGARLAAAEARGAAEAGEAARLRAGLEAAGARLALCRRGAHPGRAGTLFAPLLAMLARARWRGRPATPARGGAGAQSRRRRRRAPAAGRRTRYGASWQPRSSAPRAAPPATRPPPAAAGPGRARAPSRWGPRPGGAMARVTAAQPHRPAPGGRRRCGRHGHDPARAARSTWSGWRRRTARWARCCASRTAGPGRAAAAGPRPPAPAQTLCRTRRRPRCVRRAVPQRERANDWACTYVESAHSARHARTHAAERAAAACRPRLRERPAQPAAGRQDSGEDLADDENVLEVHIAGAELAGGAAGAPGECGGTYVSLDFFQHDTLRTPAGHGPRRAPAAHVPPVGACAASRPAVVRRGAARRRRGSSPWRRVRQSGQA